MTQQRATSTDANAHGPPRWHFAAAVSAWVLPGLGHFLLGERKRAKIIAVSIGLLWLVGLIIGGISVCDRRSAWFAGQVLLAPTLAVDYYYQLQLKHATGYRQSPSNRWPAYEPSFGHANEQGTLYTALAGLLNLLAMMDVIYRRPKRPTAIGQDANLAKRPA